MKKKGAIVHGGQFWGRLTPGGPLVPIGTDAGGATVDVWICRRVADYPGGQVPAWGAVGTCRDCGASIVFNPARVVAAPKVCMQCADIQPLPIHP